MGFHAEASRCNASGDYSSTKLPLLTARLLRERFRVDMVIAQRLARQPVAVSFWQLVGGDKGEAEVTQGLLELQDTTQVALAKAKQSALAQGSNDEEVGALYLLFKDGRGGDLSAAMDGIYDHVLALTQAPGTQAQHYERLQGLCLAIVEWAELEATLLELRQSIDQHLNAHNNNHTPPTHAGTHTTPHATRTLSDRPVYEDTAHNPHD